MKNIFAISAIAATLVAPAFADITGSSNCTEGVLGTSTNGSTANIDANWNPNTINIKWYNGDTQLTQTSCQYDTTITLPTEPSKPGYTFNGWRLRTTPPAPNCSAINNSSTCNNTSGCTWHAGQYQCVVRVNTQYTKCSEATTETECNNVTNEAGELSCAWWKNAYTNTMGCALKDFPYASSETWCEEYGSNLFYWDGSRCYLD